MTNQWYCFAIVILITLNSVNINGKPVVLTCDTSSTCSKSSAESSTDCDTCCNMLLERMFDCPPCRYFVLNTRQYGSNCFCTVCFKQMRHRRRHQQQQQQQQQNEQDSFPRFDF